MTNQFKVQDSVQLLHGPTPTMTISEINQETNEAYCIWFDQSKTKEIKKAWVPLNSLKTTAESEKITKSQLFKSIGYQH